MHIHIVCTLVTVCCVGLTYAQRANRGGGGRKGAAGGGEGPLGGEGGPIINALMNDPFAFRRFFHPLANQRFMNSMGLNLYQPNLATLGLMMDMELNDALLLGAMSGAAGMPMRGRQPQSNPFLVALGLVDGVDSPDPGQRGKSRRGRRPNRPPKAKARGGGRTEAGPHGQSEAGPRQ